MHPLISVETSANVEGARGHYGNNELSTTKRTTTDTITTPGKPRTETSIRRHGSTVQQDILLEKLYLPECNNLSGHLAKKVNFSTRTKTARQGIKADNLPPKAQCLYTAQGLYGNF
jgi:hypothetical protein